MSGFYLAVSLVGYAALGSGVDLKKPVSSILPQARVCVHASRCCLHIVYHLVFGDSGCYRPFGVGLKEPISSMFPQYVP
jgi:hypothetical protein